MTDGPTDTARCRVACPRLKTTESISERLGYGDDDYDDANDDFSDESSSKTI